MSTPRRYEKGVTNVAKSTTMGMFVDMDPSRVYGIFDDFMVYDVTNDKHWVLTTVEAGSGSATEAISDTETGGAILVTNDDASGDNDCFQYTNDGGTDDSETFLFATGKQAWFKIRFKGNDVDQSIYLVGLHITNTDPCGTAPTDGVYFQSDDGDAYVDLHVRKNGTETLTSQIASMSDDTYIVLGYHWDGVDRINYFVNDAYVGYSVTTNLPNDEYLALSFAIENGEASANTMTVDYIGAWMER